MGFFCQVGATNFSRNSFRSEFWSKDSFSILYISTSERAATHVEFFLNQNKIFKGCNVKSAFQMRFDFCPTGRGYGSL